jgi:carbon storage regulator
MLVLSRKQNERIIIGGSIEVVVVEIRGDKVRLGVVAPAETPVHRQEVWEAIRREESASGGKPPWKVFEEEDKHRKKEKRDGE